MAEDELSLLSANFAITALVAWAVAVFAVCMCMFLVLDSSKQMIVLGVVQIPTLSLTGAYQPMQAIFTLGLSWLSVATALLFNLVYFHLEGKIDDADRAAACSPSFPHASSPSRHQTSSPSGRSHHLRSAASSESLSNNDNGTTGGDLDFVSVSSAPLPQGEHQHRQQQEQQRDAIPPPARPLLPPLCCFTFTKRSCHQWNLLLWGIGMAFSVFMALVGTIPLTLNESGHGTVAIVMFIAGVAHLVVYHFSIAPLDRPSAGGGPPLAVVQKMSRQTSVRYIALGFIVPLNVCILITVFVTFLSCDSKECREYVVQMLVVMEFTTAVGLLVYVESFRTPDFCGNLLLLGRRARGVADSSGLGAGAGAGVSVSVGVGAGSSQGSVGELELATNTWAASGCGGQGGQGGRGRGGEGGAEGKTGEV